MAGKTTTPAATTDESSAPAENASAAPVVENATPSAPTEAEIKKSAKDVADANDAVVVAVDGTVESGYYDENDNNEVYVTLNKDVLEEFYYPDTKRPSYRVLYTKGQVVAKSLIDAYNATVEARAAGAPEGDEAVRATIDTTTLASGTYPGVAPAESK